jgi:hypothetical protein
MKLYKKNQLKIKFKSIGLAHQTRDSGHETEKTQYKKFNVEGLMTQVMIPR